MTSLFSSFQRVIDANPEKENIHGFSSKVLAKKHWERLAKRMSHASSFHGHNGHVKVRIMLLVFRLSNLTVLHTSFWWDQSSLSAESSDKMKPHFLCETETSTSQGAAKPSSPTKSTIKMLSRIGEKVSGRKLLVQCPGRASHGLVLSQCLLRHLTLVPSHLATTISSTLY
jgi:hypothetical protein